MNKLIDGKAIAERVKDEIVQKIFQLKGIRPNLAIILVGEREDSKLYVSLKEREGVKVGIDTHLYNLPAETQEEELLSVIEFLNQDELIDGILVQLPLPAHLNTDRIIAAIDPKKDVDGFHPEHPEYIVSPVLAAALACLDEIKLVGNGKTACLLYNSDVFGNSLKEIIKKRGFTLCSQEEITTADLIITALGKPASLTKEMIKPNSVVIDIGISKVGGKVLGDADFPNVLEKVAFITPVPGGIGPMTIAFLFKNVLEIFLRRA